MVGVESRLVYGFCIFIKFDIVWEYELDLRIEFICGYVISNYYILIVYFIFYCLYIFLKYFFGV